MKKLIPIMLALTCAGCVALRMDQSKGTASYYRLGAQDISDLHASKIGTDGSQLKVDLGRAQIGEPTIMQPDQWAGIIENYLAAGLAQSALRQIAEDILRDKAANLDIDDVKGKIGDALDKDKNKNEPPKNVDDWPDWPAGDTRYHIYAENNASPNQRGLWKPNSDSRPGEPVMLLPAHMSKTGVAKVTVGGTDITNKVRKYPTDLLPILGNGLRLHYNAPKVGLNVPVVVTLSDGSEYRATVANGGKRQDPLTFTKTKEADDDQGDAEDPGDDSNDPGSGDSDDDSDDNNSDDDGDSGNNGPIPTVGSWQPPVVQLPAWMEGKVAAVRVGKAYNMKPIGGMKYQGPPMSDPIWDGPWEAYPQTGARINMLDGRTLDSYIRNIKQPYSPMRWYDIGKNPPVEVTR
jgi:hypothetical protein